MSKSSVRSDFISDSSSSDEDLPSMGSLRDRLARKRNIAGFQSNSICSNSATLPVSPEIDNLYSADIVTVDCYSCSDNNYKPITVDNCNSTSASVTHVSSKPTEPKVKKRSAEEIQDRKRQAQGKKEQRERDKQMKEAEKEMRKIERESKKPFSLTTCLKYIQVLIDTHIVNTCGLGAVILKSCEELGVTCETRELLVPFTVMWKRQVTECKMSSDMKIQTIQDNKEEDDIIVVVPVTEFVQMINVFKLKQQGQLNEGLTFRDYVIQIESCLPDKTVTFIVFGMEQYFRDLKSKTQRKYKQAVQGSSNNTKKSNKDMVAMVTVSRVDVEEALTDTLLQTGCTTFMLEKPEEVADFIRRFSKAVAERPAKKDRFNPVFSFYEEGTSGVKVDKNGNGLLKVWKQQLLQFKNCSPDVAQAIITEYPSPLLLRKAYQACCTEREAIKLLENIVVRRGAGVLETTRRVGKEMARRIFLFFTCDDPDMIIK
ncbi:crossover junction endonuclease eme1 [Mactra antiquata]